MKEKKESSRRDFLQNTGSLIGLITVIGPVSLLNSACHNTSTDSENEEEQEPIFSDLFIANQGGYPRYRITSLAVTNSGTVLAFTQGRQEGGDNAQNDLVLRRSIDGGDSWEPLQIIADDGDRALTPHCSVVDRETGRIILISGSFPDECHSGCVEPGYEENEKTFRLYQFHSDDDGKTWSGKKDISRMAKLPSPFESTRFGAGMGIQLRNKPHEGRLIMPAINTYYDRKGKEVSAVYSDDHGETWQHGAFASKENIDSGPNETQMVELADGTVMLNTRANSFRKIAYSYDGGETWTPLQDDPQLVDSSCNASIIRYSDPLDGEKSRLLFSNPATQSKRENGMVRLSYDEGESWEVNKTFYKAGFGYSSLVRLPDGDIGMLFERDKIGKGYWRAVTFAKFSLEWLTDGKDMLIE